MRFGGRCNGQLGWENEYFVNLCKGQRTVKKYRILVNLTMISPGLPRLPFSVSGLREGKQFRVIHINMEIILHYSHVYLFSLRKRKS